MGFWKTLKNIGKVKAENTGEGIVNALAKFDPEGMSEAGMLELEDNVNTMALECAKAKQEWEKEQSEYDTIQKLFEQRMAAAESLSQDPAQAASLEKLLTMIEDMAPEIEREKQEAVFAKELFDELEAATKEAAESVKTARSEFEAVQRQMKRADVDKKRADTQEERAKKLAGIKKGGSSLGSAMDAMKKAANEKEAEADAAKMKAKLFTKADPEKDDPAIAAALAAASGNATPTMSLQERMAALKK